MSASRHVTIWCDAEREDAPWPGCRHHLEVGTTESIREARSIAKREGWAFRAGLDICPVCNGSSQPSGGDQ